MHLKSTNILFYREYWFLYCRVESLIRCSLCHLTPEIFPNFRSPPTHLRLFLLRWEFLASFASIFPSFAMMSRGLMSTASDVSPWCWEEVEIKSEFCSRTIVSKLLIFCSILDKTSQLSLSPILNRWEILDVRTN